MSSQHPTLAAYPKMLERSRKCEGLRVCRAAWLLGVTVREYRALEARDAAVTYDLWKRMVDVFGCPSARSSACFYLISNPSGGPIEREEPIAGLFPLRNRVSQSNGSRHAFVEGEVADFRRAEFDPIC
jgi:hypothetical protein